MRIRNERGVYERVPMEQRFWEKVDKRGVDECWLWQGKPEESGYARITDFWEKSLVHRYSYELHYAPIPRWIPVQVCHSCDTPLCVNPRHLWLGTAQTNTNERIARGRSRYPGPTNPNRGETNGHHKVTEDQVREIRAKYLSRTMTLAQLGAEYGLAVTGIHAIVQRRTWKHVD